MAVTHTAASHHLHTLLDAPNRSNQRRRTGGHTVDRYYHRLFTAHRCAPKDPPSTECLSQKAAGTNKFTAREKRVAGNLSMTSAFQQLAMRIVRDVQVLV